MMNKQNEQPEIGFPVQALVNLIKVLDNSFERGAVRGDEALVVGVIRQEILTRVNEWDRKNKEAEAEQPGMKSRAETQND